MIAVQYISFSDILLQQILRPAPSDFSITAGQNKMNRDVILNLYLIAMYRDVAKEIVTFSGIKQYFAFIIFSSIDFNFSLFSSEKKSKEDRKITNLVMIMILSF